MRSVYNYVVEPLGERYSNIKKVGDKELIINTEVSNHQHVNREAVVISTPSADPSTCVKVGDKVMVHHNVFRRWHNQYGEEKNSRSYLEEGRYLVAVDQMYLRRVDGDSGDWSCLEGYCFVQPIKDNSQLKEATEMPLVGIVKYSDGTVPEGELVGFRPSGEFEFVVDGQRMYRVLSKFITIKYEYQGDEEEYNPSWADSC
tara:strand:+ start:517 stop:1119 length:603 start_codon:yes stop_codon:yes gene_type:complete